MKTKYHELNRAVEKAIANFNFGNVRNVMLFLNWTWHPENEVPTFERMKQTVRMLAKNLKPGGRSQTGGFGVSLENCEEGLIFTIDFTLQTSESSVEQARTPSTLP